MRDLDAFPTMLTVPEAAAVLRVALFPYPAVNTLHPAAPAEASHLLGV